LATAKSGVHSITLAPNMRGSPARSRRTSRRCSARRMRSISRRSAWPGSTTRSG